MGLALALTGLALPNRVLADPDTVFWDHGQMAGFTTTVNPDGSISQAYHLEGLAIFPHLGRIQVLEGIAPVTGPPTAVANQTIKWAGGSPGQKGAYGTFTGQTTYTTMDGSQLVASFAGSFVNATGTTTFTGEVAFSGTGRLAEVTGTGYIIVKNVVHGHPPFSYDLIGTLWRRDRSEE
jgi:hypothetical protein